MSNQQNDFAWQTIFNHLNIHNHNFKLSPFIITATQIRQATRQYKTAGQTEPRILCKQDTREDRPLVFKANNLFILPTRNGEYAIVQGEGYVDIPEINTSPEVYIPSLGFELLTSLVGNSEMQHLDYCYATSLLREFTGDKTIVLTIRGRKYTPQFSFSISSSPFSGTVTVEGVQTEVDGGYEGVNNVFLIEVKSRATNTIIRQLYYPYRQWLTHLQSMGSSKSVSLIYFTKDDSTYKFWEFKFLQQNDYNSISLVRSNQYLISSPSSGI